MSTYQDGSGQEKVSGATLPGWRDFERTTAAAFGGEAQESKAVFDVLVSDPTSTDAYCGVSCKMRGELGALERKGYATLELSNALKAFWKELGKQGITTETYKNDPKVVGEALLRVVTGWHVAAAARSAKRSIDVGRSCYLALMWRKSTKKYKLLQFPLKLPAAESLQWSCPIIEGNDTKAQRIVGKLDNSVVLEWYGQSGGQLKYYPREEDAYWATDPFELEPVPGTAEKGLEDKAKAYYPEQWAKLSVK